MRLEQLNDIRRQLGMLLGSLLVALQFGLLHAQEKSAPTPPKAPPDAALEEYDPTKQRPDAAAGRSDNMRGLLWELKSQGNSVYLFGTIHVGKPSFYPLPDAVEQAYRLSKFLVVEADITNQKDAAEMTQLIDYPKGDSIDKHIPKPMFERLKTQLARTKIPLANVSSMRPVMLGGLLPLVEYGRLGYDMNNGLDLWLLKRATSEKKPVLELESPLGQIKLLTGMPGNVQEAFLDNALTMIEQDRVSIQVTDLVNAWQTGNAKLLQDIAHESERCTRMNAEINHVLLAKRNDAMLLKIVEYLKSGDIHFVAVGSLHLVGAQGIVEMLRAKGFEVLQR